MAPFTGIGDMHRIYRVKFCNQVIKILIFLISSKPCPLFQEKPPQLILPVPKDPHRLQRQFKPLRPKIRGNPFPCLSKNHLDHLSIHAKLQPGLLLHTKKIRAVLQNAGTNHKVLSLPPHRKPGNHPVSVLPKQEGEEIRRVIPDKIQRIPFENTAFLKQREHLLNLHGSLHLFLKCPAEIIHALIVKQKPAYLSRA